MEVLELDPNKLEIDPLNERTENVGPHKDEESLEKSIREQGIIQPPIARRHDGSYSVIVGQRRTLAAQSAGVEKIPVVVMDWDDTKALEASITENVDAFRKSVSRTDRAAALKKLMEIGDHQISDLATTLGVSDDTVRMWLERTHDAWEDTTVHVDERGGSAELEEKTTEVENIPDTELATIRRATSSPEERQRVVDKVAEKDLARRDIREATKRAKRGEGSLEEIIDEVSQEKVDREQEGIKIETRITFSGTEAQGIQMAAKDLGTSEENIVRKAIEDYLEREGYR